MDDIGRKLLFSVYRKAPKRCPLLVTIKGFLQTVRNCTVEEAAGTARELGIQYLKLKDRDIDTFLKEGAKQIIDESEEKSLPKAAMLYYQQ